MSTAPAPDSNPLFEELRWVHSMIRRDLATVRELAAGAAEGMAADQISSAIAELKTNGPLWQLKVNCLHYCRFVHHHHHLEDIAIFPTLRRLDPQLEPVVDKLEADHREVAELLEGVEGSAQALSGPDGETERARLVAALERLADTLLAHLEYEETNLEAPLGRMRSWTG